MTDRQSNKDKKKEETFISAFAIAILELLSLDS